VYINFARYYENFEGQAAMESDFGTTNADFIGLFQLNAYT
jgi:hypothetical protein